LITQFKAADWEKLAVAAKFQPETLASLCGVTLRLLERFFKRQFGKTPVAWMREQRCRRAAVLIAEGCCLKVAGEGLGFASASHLCHEFRKVFGVSPVRFARRLYRRKKRISR
jgi:AraC-like DNA-binding protein